MKEYLLIVSTMMGHDTTCMKIIATDYIEALAKGFTYFGKSRDLKAKEFKVLCEHSDMKRSVELFQRLVGQTVLYFGEASEEELVDELEIIDVINMK